jgi:predicted transcriptional regulator
MSSIKKQAIKLIKNLPENFSWEELQEILYKMYVIKSVEQGLKDVEEGRTISLEEAKKRLLKKYEN